MLKEKIPNINQLRSICQKVKCERSEWQYIIHRKLSIYITWVLLHSGLTANHITLLSFLLGLFGAAVIITTSGFWVLAGYLLFYGYFILDKVDGEVARFKKEESLRGIYLDYVGHMLIPPLAPLAIGVNLGQFYDSNLLWLTGAIGAICCILMRSVVNLPDVIIIKKHALQSELFKKSSSKTSIKNNDSTPLPAKNLLHLTIKILNTLTFSGYFGTCLLLAGATYAVCTAYSPFRDYFVVLFVILSMCQFLIAVIVITDYDRKINEKVSLSLSRISEIASDISLQHGEDIK